VRIVSCVNGEQMDAAETPGMRAATAAGIGFEVARTARPSSAEESAALQGIELGQLLRTIVIRRGAHDYVFVLVPGGRQIDWPKLRAHLGVKRLSLPSADEAKNATGYERGTITPFGASHAWPVIADAATGAFSVVAIGAGAHGVNLHVDSAALLTALAADVADVTRPDEPASTT
jgi:Cys-tRNA(Pro)/Cys-tRNA(Cys) deacylase